MTDAALPYLTPQFADPAAEALPLHVVPSDGIDALTAELGPEAAVWLAATGFKGDLGELRLLPASGGGLAGAVAGYGTAKARRRMRFGLAKAVAALPAGAWRIEGELSKAEREEAALGWVLTQYRFGRYRTPKTDAGALLVCPEGVDAARVIAMARGEFLTRDLINTPAQDMGPGELEAAFAA
ncbi:MAG: leucyl aminopeptidase, partial [Rhodobacter sp.]|nr:leucyl aminopeptidase [Rhodobacter sp.]